MKVVKRLFQLWKSRPVCALLGLGLSAGFVQAGTPIVFVRQATTVSSNNSQVLVKQADKRVSTALDALEAPTPLDGVLTGPTPERSRQGRDGQRSRRAEQARKERADWMFNDDKDVEQEDALSDQHNLDAEVDEADRKDPRRPKLRQSTAEKRADEREARIPAHLLSPETRQRMQTEAMARRAQSSRANADFSESSSSSGSDLSKMLAPPDESKAASGMSRNLREFRSPEVSSSRRSAEPNELGAGSGSELSLGPNITGPRLGPDLGESRTSGSLLDRNSDPERVNPPIRGFGLGGAEPPRSPSIFPSFNDQFKSTFPSATPGNTLIGPSARDLPSLDDLNRPRRGGTLGR
jgi:hypothetical protein